MVIFRSRLIGMRKFQIEDVEKMKTRILCSITFFPPRNRAVYEIVWKNMVEPDRTQMTIRRMRVAAGYQRLQTHTRNMLYLLNCHRNNGFTKAPQCYVYTYVACLVYSMRVTIRVKLRNMLKVIPTVFF